MRFMKKVTVLMAAAVLTAGMLSGCSNSKDNAEESNKSSSDKKTDSTQSSGEDQLAEPQAGDTLAVFHIKDYGDITVRLFPKAAPKAVENFTTHAREGYYDGVVFHRVIDNFMIQGGDPEGTGRGGESIWGKAFEDEFVENLMPIRGALCMANAGEDTNGSQFFIVQTKQPNLDYASQPLNDEQKKMFEENGGAAHLVYAHTVFGQVTEGMEVVDTIAAVRTDASARPVSDVVIESIEIKEQK